MNLQQVVQSRSAANGFSRRRNEKDVGPRLDSKPQTGKANSNRLTSTGKEGGSESSSRERLVYLTTCLIGHHVEVQVLDGSIFSGIFHATNAEKDFGIVLKMARLTKDASRGQKNILDGSSKLPSKTLIIPAAELVQVIAKGVPVTRDGLTTELELEKHEEVFIDSYISHQSRRVDPGRELAPWVPDDNDPACPELENIFDVQGKRGWNQFEVNETLFGVKSTFDEEIYTTKLEKGPQMKDLEREAVRIAREIEGEDTIDLHLAEERGIKLHEKYEIDEETRFSSVFRGVDDSGYDDSEDRLLDTHNDETFGGGYDSIAGESFPAFSGGERNDGGQDEVPPSTHYSTDRDTYQSISDDQVRQLSAGQSRNALPVGDSRAAENQFPENAASSYSEECSVNRTLYEEAQTSNPNDSHSPLWLRRDSSDKGGLSANATAYAPSKAQENISSSNDPSDGSGSSKAQGTTQSARSRVPPGSSASSTSECGVGTSASGAPELSPSSSVGSLSSEKSTLNPNAKEFKLNPSAKSFMPSHSPLRPASPVSDGSFYYPPNMTAVPHMPGMPVGIGIGPSFAAHQPVIFNPQATSSPQPYFHPNVPQYGQQMMIGHPRQVFYMPTYTPEMPYKGRDF